MGTGLKIAIVAGLAFLVFGFGGCMYVVGVNNDCVRFENGIDAQFEQNQNNLANYTNKVMEMVQVPKMAKDQIAEVAKAAIQGRYGEKGSQALFQAIAEQNPTMPSNLYTNIQQAMESGRDSFAADQKMVIDKCNVYRNYYGEFPTSFVAGFFGYPKLDQTKCKPVITDDTAKAFETKRSGPVQIQ